MDAKCKTKGTGNNITTNINNNHITMHIISPKFTHMYMSYVQRPLNVRNLTVPLKMNMEICGNGSMLNPATENCTWQWQKCSSQNFSQPCVLCQPCICLSLLVEAVKAVKAVKALTAQTAHGMHVNVQEQTLPREVGSCCCGNMIDLLICYSLNGNWVQAKGQNRHFIFCVKGGRKKMSLRSKVSS